MDQCVVIRVMDQFIVTRVMDQCVGIAERTTSSHTIVSSIKQEQCLRTVGRTKSCHLTNIDVNETYNDVKETCINVKEI